MSPILWLYPLVLVLCVLLYATLAFNSASRREAAAWASCVLWVLSHLSQAAHTLAGLP